MPASVVFQFREGSDQVMRLFRLLAFAGAIGTAAAPAHAHAGELRISIEGLHALKGTILIGLYDSKESFERAIALAGKNGYRNDPERVAGAALRVDHAAKSGIAFENLAAGRYAVIVFHDADGNGRLDKNLLGVPTEAYGFSNGARGFLGPPSFRDASVAFDGTEMDLAISLVQPEASVGSSRAPDETVNRGSGGGQ
jgi:uncharacterized protein (DUF2141 family)